MPIHSTLDRAGPSIRPPKPTVAKNAPWAIYRDSCGDSPWEGPFRLRRDAVRAAVNYAFPWGNYVPTPAILKRINRKGWHVRRVSWQQREEWRFQWGASNYRHPVWTKESFWRNRSAALIQHYAHAAKKDPSSIAFTESDDKGMRDVQTVMKAGRYLKRFFGDVLTDKQIAFYAEWQRAGNRPPSDFTKTLKLEFATTPEAIVAAYAEGPGSCMRGYEAVQVYGAGDLAIACLVRPGPPRDGERRVLARALVWPAKKVVGRIYPNEGDYSDFSGPEESEDVRNELLNRLLADGYRSTYSEGWDLFDGAKLLAISAGGGEYVMPYIDGTCIDFHGSHFTMSENGDISAESTCGTIEFEDGGCVCGSCGDSFDEEDMTSVYTEVTSEGYPRSALNFCSTCVEDDTFYCSATEHYLTNVAANPVEMASGHGIGQWNDVYLSARDGFVCAHDRLGRLSGESERFPGFAAAYDDDPDVHPEIQPQLQLSAPDAETPREAA